MEATHMSVSDWFVARDLQRNWLLQECRQLELNLLEEHAFFIPRRSFADLLTMGRVQVRFVKYNYRVVEITAEKCVYRTYAV